MPKINAWLKQCFEDTAQLQALQEKIQIKIKANSQYLANNPFYQSEIQAFLSTLIKFQLLSESHVRNVMSLLELDSFKIQVVPPDGCEFIYEITKLTRILEKFLTNKPPEVSIEDALDFICDRGVIESFDCNLFHNCYTSLPYLYKSKTRYFSIAGLCLRKANNNFSSPYRQDEYYHFTHLKVIASLNQLQTSQEPELSKLYELAFELNEKDINFLRQIQLLSSGSLISKNNAMMLTQLLDVMTVDYLKEEANLFISELEKTEIINFDFNNAKKLYERFLPSDSKTEGFRLFQKNFLLMFLFIFHMVREKSLSLSEYINQLLDKKLSELDFFKSLLSHPLIADILIKSLVETVQYLQMRDDADELDFYRQAKESINQFIKDIFEYMLDSTLDVDFKHTFNFIVKLQKSDILDIEAIPPHIAVFLLARSVEASLIIKDEDKDVVARLFLFVLSFQEKSDETKKNLLRFAFFYQQQLPECDSFLNFFQWSQPDRVNYGVIYDEVQAEVAAASSHKKTAATFLFFHCQQKLHAQKAPAELHTHAPKMGVS